MPYQRSEGRLCCCNPLIAEYQMTSQKPPRPKKPFLKTGVGAILFFVCSVVVLNWVATAIGKRVNPERYAQVYDCRGEGEGRTFYPNTCEFDINVRYCLFLKTDQPGGETFCRTTLLKPGDGVETLIKDRMDLKAEGREIWSSMVWSCKAPFEPAMVPTLHNSMQKEKGCRKPRPATDAEG